MAELSPPLPAPTPTSQPFWDGLRDGVVRLQRCDDCGTWIYYARSHCTSCLSTDLTWTDIGGGGTIYTFTVARQPTMPHFADEVPQLLAVIELDEGPRITSTLVDIDPDAIEIGMRVEPVFDHKDDEVTLLRYRPV